MKDLATNTTRLAGSTVVAITQEQNILRAVCLQKCDSGFEIVWTQSADASRATWRSFAVECGLSVETPTQKKPGKNDEGKKVVAGFDSAGVVFYRFDVPAVKEQEIEPIIRLQAETYLPLPAEQMELAWRLARPVNGQVGVTIAAAKKQHLQNYLENVSLIKPAEILLDCEAIVRVWRTCFLGNDEAAVIISMGSRTTKICLADHGNLVNAATLDLGSDDFTLSHEPCEQAEAAEMFAHDTRGVLELFGYTEPETIAVFVLSAPTEADGLTNTIVSSLKSVGLNVSLAVPQTDKLLPVTIVAEDVYEYRVPIGLALTALEPAENRFDIFKNLYQPPSKQKTKRWFYSLKTAGVITLLMLALLVAVLYAEDVIGEKHLTRLQASSECAALLQQQKLIKTVALNRVDLLGLLSQINQGENKGIVLDSLGFKKGRPVTIAGQADNAEQMYKFEKYLLEQKSITGVKILNPSKDSKSKKIKFNMTFHYKNFTRKKSPASIGTFGAPRL